MSKYDLAEWLLVRTFLDQMLTMWNAVEAGLEQIPPEKIRECLGDGNDWLKQYDMSPVDAAREVASIAGMRCDFDHIAGLGTEAAQKEGLMALMSSRFAGPAVQGVNVERKDYGAALIQYQRTRNYFMSLFVYGQPIQSLVQAARRGNESALMKALSVDRLIVGLPEIQDRIARGQLLREDEFLNKVDKATKGPSGHIPRDLPLLRAFLWFTHNGGLLGKLSQDERYKLFCEELHLYPSEGKDAWAGVNRFINRWQESLET